jgi:5-methylcytosine-specific restriction protein A
MSWGTQRTSSARWKKLRLAILERDRWLCQIRGDRCTVRADTVDHIVPHFRGGPSVPSNLQAACTPCHRQKTASEAASARQTRKRPPEPHPGLLP